MHTSFYVCPFLCGYVLGGFHHLVIVNNAGVNIDVYYLFESLFSIILSIYPEVESLGQR